MNISASWQRVQLLSNFASCCWLSTALSTISPTNSPHRNTFMIYLYHHVPPAHIVSETAPGDVSMKRWNSDEANRAPPHSTTSELFESPFRWIALSKGNRMPIRVFHAAQVVSWMELPVEEAECLLANRIYKRFNEGLHLTRKADGRSLEYERVSKANGKR